MTNEHHPSDFINELSLQIKMENIWRNTCKSWQNCNEATIQAFLSQCYEYHLDPQYCMGWVEQHKNEVPNWPVVSAASLDWINRHTSSGSPMSAPEDTLS